jgi:hypothetical protein
MQHIQIFCPLHLVLTCNARQASSRPHLGAPAVEGGFDFCFVSIYKWVTYKIIKVLISSLKTDTFLYLHRFKMHRIFK